MKFSLLICVLLFSSLPSQAKSNEYRTIICEYSGKRIACPYPQSADGTDYSFMNITYAMYGYQEKTRCRGASNRGNCSSPKAFSIVSRLCNGQQSCFLEAVNSIFGDPCHGVVKYLQIHWTCIQVHNIPSVQTQEETIFSDIDATSGVAKILSDEIISNASKTAISYKIYSIQELSTQVNLKHINNSAALNLLKKPLIRRPLYQKCLASTGLTNADSYFCIYENSGIIAINSKNFNPKKNVLKQYLIKVLIQHVTFTIVSYKSEILIKVLPSCYPLTSLYMNMTSNCPSANKIYRHSGSSITSPTDFFTFDIPGPMKLAALYVNSNYTNFKANGNPKCDMTVRINYFSDLYIRHAEHYTNSSIITGFSEKARIAGEQYDVNFRPPIKMLHELGGTSYVRIDYNCTMSTVTRLRYTSKKSMHLYVVPIIKTCPNTNCMDIYYQWYLAYELIRKHGKIGCLKDDKHQLAYLESCLDFLYLVTPYTFPFGKKIQIRCEGGYRYPKKRWYQNGVLLPYSGSVLHLSGDTFNQSGRYWCATDNNRKSPSVQIVFQDVTNSTISLNIVNVKYKEVQDRTSHMYSKTLTLLQTELYRILPKTWTYKQDILFMGFRDWNTNVNALFKILAHFPKNAKKVTYYSALKSHLIQSIEQKKFGFLKIPKDLVQVRSFDKCLNETTGSTAGKGLSHWPSIAVGKTVKLSCPFGPKGVSIRRGCVKNSLYGATWTSYKDDDCSFASETTNKLNDLSTKPINETSAKKVAKELKGLSAKPKALTGTDTSFIGDTVSNLVNSNITTDEVVNDILATTSNVMQVNKTSLRNSQKTDKTLSKLVKNIAKLASKLEPPGKPNTPVVKVSSKIALQAVKVDKQQKVPIKISVGGEQSEGFQESDILYGDESKNSKTLTSMTLPPSIFSDAGIGASSPKKISFVVYKEDTLFQGIADDENATNRTRQSLVVNSMVLAAEVHGVDRVNLSTPLLGTYEHKNSSTPGICVFWEFSAAGGNGAWSTQGCKAISSSSTSTVCQCDHLTNFAILLDPYAGEKSISGIHKVVLERITYIGIGLSLFGLTMTIITMTFFRRLRKTLPSKILVHLCVSLMLTLIIFVVGVQRTEPMWACKTSAALMHYFLLVTFSWMLVEAINLYLRFVKVLGSHVSKFMLKAGLLCWGLPAAVIAFLLPLRWDDYGPGELCVVTGNSAYGAVFAPIILMLVINVVIFIMVMKAVSSSSSKLTKDKKLDGRALLRISFMCCVLVGLTWGFGVFAISDARIVFQYLFCIFNSLQGFFIFYFHVIRQADIRNRWLNYLTGNVGKYSTSSSYSRKVNGTRKDTKGTTRSVVKESDQSKQDTLSKEKDINTPKEYCNKLYEIRMNKL